jgi:hypothetical protein
MFNKTDWLHIMQDIEQATVSTQLLPPHTIALCMDGVVRGGSRRVAQGLARVSFEVTSLLESGALQVTFHEESSNNTVYVQQARASLSLDALLAAV